MRRNQLRELLNTGRPSLGTRLHSAWPTITELVGQSGCFDYVEILAEYAPYELFSLENLGRAINLFDQMTGMIKVPQENRAHVAVRALNSGIANVLFADVRTVADVRECVRAVRAETPELGGLRGVGQGRDVGIVLEVGSAAYAQSTAESVVALMIEKKQAIEDLEALLSVPGVDMVQFGPADYAMSIGVVGQRGHPAVREAERYMIETALRKGITPRAEIHDPSEAEPYLALGVRHFCMGTDVRTLFFWYRDRGARMREIFADTRGEH
ncbi:MAG TPA: aldolase/citrate lyase family protein [Chloroflexota bacterium]|nr:aldolase/citrate lyase family protein [Chloroflexota bacterium]